MEVLLFISLIAMFVIIFWMNRRIKGMEKNITSLKNQVNELGEISDLHSGKLGKLLNNEAMDRQVPDRYEIDNVLSKKTNLENAQNKLMEPMKQDPKKEIKKEIKRPTILERYLRSLKTWFKLEKDKGTFSVAAIISKIGILLLLIGIGYIFKLAYDQGYISRELAVFMGAVLGLLMIGLGMLAGGKDHSITSQVLTGGGIATLYITVFGAYQFYGFIGLIASFILMGTITFVGFLLSYIENHVSVAIIGMMGGLMTPFVLSFTQLGLIGVGVYILMLTLGAHIIYIFKKWRLLQLLVIVGTYAITSFFVTLPMGGQAEKAQYSLLIVIILLITNGVEYGLAYFEFESRKWRWLTWLILGGTPILTYLQFLDVFEPGRITHGLVLGLTAMVYLLLTAALYRRLGQKFVSDLTLSFTGAFVLFTILVLLEGQVAALVIVVTGLIYGLIFRKYGYKMMWIVGTCLSIIGFGMALIEWGVQTADHDPTWVEHVIRSIILIALTMSASIYKRQSRRLISVLGLAIYGPLMVETAFYMMLEKEGAALLFVGAIVYLYGAHYVNHRLKLLPRYTLFIVALVPVFLRLLVTSIAVFDDQINYYSLGGMVFYAVGLYIYAQRLVSDLGSTPKKIIKFVAYGLVFMGVLTDVSIATNHLVIALLTYLLLFYILEKVEPDREEKWMQQFMKVLLGFGLVSAYIYLVTRSLDMTLSKWYFLLDLLLLVGIAYSQKRYFGWLDRRIGAFLWMLAYMILIYQWFEATVNGQGTITILWALYSVLFLGVSVYKQEKSLANMALVMVLVVAGKYVVVDMSELTMIWKIVISMVFGSVLIFLSFILQPILERKGPEA